MFSVGIEARGFFFGPSIALAIGAKFIPLRKPRKLPGIALQIFSSLQFKKVLFMQLMHTSMIYHMNDLYLRTWNWLLLYLHGIPYFLLPCPLTYVGLCPWLMFEYCHLVCIAGCNFHFLAFISHGLFVESSSITGSSWIKRFNTLLLYNDKYSVWTFQVLLYLKIMC